LIIPLAIGQSVKADLAVADPFVVGVDFIMEGYQPDAMPAAMGLNAVYNATIPTVSLQGAGFTETDKNPADFASEGITRTYSDAYLGAIMETSINTASGIYQTLKGIIETEFSQATVDQDVSVYTYTPLESFYQTVNDTLNALDPDWTAQNFTIGDLYAEISFDKAMMDAFFLEVKSKANFDFIAEEHSTNQQMITTLLDEIFGANIFDIIYAPVNVTDYACSRLEHCSRS